MANSIFPTPFKLTHEELLLSSAATVIFKAISDSGRENIQISNICENPQYGYTASAETIENGPRFVRITDIKGGEVNWDTVPYCTCADPDKYVLSKGDVLVARAGSIGKSFLVDNVPETAVFASYMIRLRTKNGTLPDYIYWFFQSQQFWLQIVSFDRGSAMSNINGKMLSKLVLPELTQAEQEAITNFLQTYRRKIFGENVDLPELPSPMEDIRRIVARIETLAGRIADAKSLRLSAMGETEKLIGNEIAAMFNNANGWQDYTLGDLTLESVYGTSAKAHIENLGIPVLRMGNIQDGKIDLSDLKYMHPSEKEMQKLRLKSGDILVNRTNSAELVGKCAVFDLEGDYIFASYIIRLRLDQQKADPYLVAQYINSPIGRAYMFAERKQMTGQANVNSKKLAALPIKLPSLDEQRRIVAYLDGLSDRVNALRRLQAESQVELDALLPSVLDRAFKGEL